MIKKISFILCLIFSIFLLYSCNTTSNKDIVDIKVINIPDQIEIGKFDDAGIEFEITYEDNEIEIEKVTEDKIPEEYKHYLYEEGNHSFSFLYKGIEVTFNIEMYKVGHSVTFINKNDEVVKKVILKENETLVFPTEEEMYVEGYKFLSFDHDGTNITSDITIRGIYVKVWTVSFYNGKNELIKIDLVEEGKSATEPTTQERVMEGYKFISWDTNFTNITTDIEVYGIYQKINQDDNEASQGLEYELNEDGKSYTLVGIGTCKDTDIIISSTHKGYPVTSIRYGSSKDDMTITRITSITIPDTVISIEEYALLNCESLTCIIVDENNSYYKSIDGNLYSKDGNVLVRYSIGKKESLFIIPDGVTSIRECSFHRCANLTNIIIPDSVINIGEGSFFGCENLINITIPDSVISIEDSAFSYCYSLTSIVVGANNNYYKSIDGNLYTKDGGVLIQYAIGKKDSTFVIPNSVISIGYRAFDSCDSLTSIIISDNVISIGDQAFDSCDSLTNIIIPDSVTSIGDQAFYSCDSLTNIIIPDSVTSIGDEAFYSCNSLTNIIIPGSVTSIGDNAFSDCYSLTSIVVGANNNYYKSIDGNLYTKDGGVLIQYAIGKKDSTFVIPNSVISIGDQAFDSCDSLTNIIIPDSVISIGDSAFSSCSSLTSIIIPSGVTKIGSRTFVLCRNLTSIIIPSSVTSIGDSAFYSCNSLTNIIIPDSVTSIGSHAFYYCGRLTSLILSDSVTSIGKNAFHGCNNLTIYCEAKVQPSGWDNDWNYSNRPVIWGYINQ